MPAMLEVLGVSGVDEEFARLERELTEVIRGITVAIFQHTLILSPQFYGRFVESWTYGVGNSPFLYNAYLAVPPMNEQGHRAYGMAKAGDMYAIAKAQEGSAGHDELFQLGDTVWIANAASHVEAGRGAANAQGRQHKDGKGDIIDIADAIENDAAFISTLRPENVIEGAAGRPLGRAVDAMEITLRDDMNKDTLEYFMTLRLV